MARYKGFKRPLAIVLSAAVALGMIGMNPLTARADTFVPTVTAIPSKTPNIELTSLSITGGSIVRPSVFDSNRTIYWVKPDASNGGTITVSASAPAGATLSYTLDDADHIGNVFNLLLSPTKLMSEIGIKVTNGTQTNHYYLDVCSQDPTSYTVTEQYYPGMKPYNPTTEKTLVLPDQLPEDSSVVNPTVLGFVAQYLEGSQKNPSIITGPVLKQNPLWHSLHYHLSIWNNPGASIIWNDEWTDVEWTQLEALFQTDPGIFVYAIDKRINQVAPVLDVAYGSYLMNIANENYYQWLLANIINQCRADNYDSVFLDSYNMDCVYAFTGENFQHYDGTEMMTYQDPQLGGMTWAQASEEFMARLTRDLNRAGIWSLPNLGNQRTSWDPIDYAYSNGGMFEQAPETPTVAHGDWQQDMSRYIYLAGKDKVLIYQNYSVTDINDAATRLYVTAAYQMGRGDYTYINEMVEGQSQASWYPEYAIGAMLGAATETASSSSDTFIRDQVDPIIEQYAIGNNLYERKFQNGLVVINADAGGASHNFTVPSDGRSYRSVTIQPGSGGTVPEYGGIAAITGASNYPLIETPVSAGQPITLPGDGALILVCGNNAIAADKAALTWLSIMNTNTSKNNVTADLINPLPTSGAHGTTITWSEPSATGLVNLTTGEVTRPSYSSGDATVTLRATISLGTESDTVDFVLIVKKMPQKPVVNTGGAATVDFAGSTFDLTAIDGLFAIDPNAGARIYTIQSGGTGEGFIGADKKTLTVTRAGTFVIGLTTAPQGDYAAGAMVKATLTVKNPAGGSGAQPAAVTGIRSAQSTFYVLKGKSLTIPYAFDLQPGETKAPVFTWTSNNDKNVSVTQNGKVTGLAAGKSAKITLRADNGSTKTFTVKVAKTALKVTKVSVTKPPKTLMVGKTAILKVKASPSKATGAVVKFSLDKASAKVVSVDKAGKVTALAKGTARITVKDGGKKTVITIKVK